MAQYKKLEDLAKDYPDKSKREAYLKQMSNADIDTMIKNMQNVQGKIYLKSFKK